MAYSASLAHQAREVLQSAADRRRLSVPTLSSCNGYRARCSPAPPIATRGSPDTQPARRIGLPECSPRCRGRRGLSGEGGSPCCGGSLARVVNRAAGRGRRRCHLHSCRNTDAKALTREAVLGDHSFERLSIQRCRRGDVCGMPRGFVVNSSLTDFYRSPPRMKLTAAPERV